MQWVEQTHNFGSGYGHCLCALSKKGPSRVQPSRMPQQEKVKIRNQSLTKSNEIKIQRRSEVRDKYKERTANWRAHIENSKSETGAHGSK